MHDQMTQDVKAALEQCRTMIAVGSKSFSLAAKIFRADTRDAAFFLYGWCRYCDDQVDLKSPADSAADAEKRLEHLQAATRSAFTQEKLADPVFIALQYIARRYNIPEHYPLELLEGMAMDVRGERYKTLNDLLLYCYRVAGTVGLMMTHIMGVSDEAALEHAVNLGIAMQLTNIARDITEDAEQGRVYLPLSWLEEIHLSPEKIDRSENRQKLAQLASRLLTEAEDYYRSGDAGLRYLSFRSACAVAAARHVYSEIGNLINRRGATSWDHRTYVRRGRKLSAVARGMLHVIGSIPNRAQNPWSRVTISRVQKYSVAH
ncbi:MAG: squalene/phytoene synthase family protein [Deltaproteobacteria bacterium]|nr:squalene/phytoene synthase family protein [Deltaproteobacteria bacterium]